MEDKFNEWSIGNWLNFLEEGYGQPITLSPIMVEGLIELLEGIDEQLWEE